MEPQIRFKDITSNWKTCKLEECLKISNERNDKLVFDKIDALSISDDSGVVNQIQHLGRSYVGADVSSYKILRKNQVVYTKSPLKSKPYGIIKSNNGNAGIVSVLYAVYDVGPNVLPQYISRYFEPSQRINKYLLPLISKGAKNTINISDENAIKGEIYIPSIEIQGKIVNLFDSIDKNIFATEDKLKSLKKLKSASLVAMFPQNGESTPKVRFKGFEGEWRRIKFSTISSRVTRRNDMLECELPLTISANEGLISQEKFFNNIVASSNLGNYYLLKRGEFAYNKSYSNGYPFGAIKRLDKYDSGVLSPLYICFSLDDKVDSNYICSFFETTLWHKDIAERATEGARNHGILNIGTEDFFDIDITIPETKEEQQAIASFFRSLDRKIALETARLEKLKQIKLACLDKMFV